MNNFDLKKFLVENKLTSNSRKLTLNEMDSTDSMDSAYDEVTKDVNKAKKLASLIAPGDDMLQKAATYGAEEVIQVGADVVGQGSDDTYAYDGVLTQNDFMQMFRKAGYSREAIEVLMDIDYVRKEERG